MSARGVQKGPSGIRGAGRTPFQDECRVLLHSTSWWSSRNCSRLVSGWRPCDLGVVSIAVRSVRRSDRQLSARRRIRLERRRRLERSRVCRSSHVAALERGDWRARERYRVKDSWVSSPRVENRASAFNPNPGRAASAA